MSVESTSVVIKTMTARTKTREKSFGSSVQNAKLDSYIRQNVIEYEGANSPSTNGASVRSMEGGMIGGYVPSFDGYLDIGFSIHVPCDHTMEDCMLTINDEQQGRMESLVMLYLCSQGLELVISTAPTTLIHVCPFQNENNRSAVTAKTKSSENVDLGDDENTTPMMLWNLPRIETETLAFDEHPEDSQTVLDMATNNTMYVSKAPLQYFTQITFTYPVYQWGSKDPDIVDVLQDGFDNGVISSGTLDSLLPWTDAMAAPLGDEPYVFWNEPFPGTVRTFDTTIPVAVGDSLRWIGGTIMVLNTVVCVVLSLISHCRNRRLRKSKLALDEEDRRRNESSPDYLDTEAGVSAILMESKHYALAKSGVHQHRVSSGSADRNILGVEVNLKMADHPSHLLTHHQSMHHYDHQNVRHKPKSPGEKEEDLLARARYRSAPATGVSTSWYTAKNLLNNGRDDEDDDSETDLQMLDLAPAPSNGDTESEC